MFFKCETGSLWGLWGRRIGLIVWEILDGFDVGAGTHFKGY